MKNANQQITASYVGGIMKKSSFIPFKFCGCKKGSGNSAISGDGSGAAVLAIIN
jgi:hypothetical protein